MGIEGDRLLAEMLEIAKKHVKKNRVELCKKKFIKLQSVKSMCNLMKQFVFFQLKTIKIF